MVLVNVEVKNNQERLQMTQSKKKFGGASVTRTVRVIFM